MPLPNKAKSNKPAKPAGRKLSDLNLPQSGGALIVGDAQKTKCDDWFDNPKSKYSSSFDILNAEHSHYQDKETCLFLVRSHEDEENYYFYMGANETRKAIVDAFAESDEPILGVRLERIPTGQAMPFIAIVDVTEENEDTQIPF